MKRLLLVDDEQNVLNALQRELREHYEIETFNNPLMALARCGEVQFDLVISDYKMPEMNGLEFLKQFGPLQPDAARLVLSGEADIEALIRTINETHIYRFIAKPWDRDELLSSIQQALDYRDVILENRRQAEAYRDSQALLQTPQHNTPFRIALVENDERLLTVMSRGLTDESGRENLYDAMQQEIKQSTHNKKFKCVVDTFRSAQTALAHAEKTPYDLIIAAQTLPDMNGVQLLHKMRQTLPDSVRILISNNLDKTILSQAINEAEVQSVLRLQWSSHEPRTDARRQAWNLYQLKTAAIQALASRELLSENARLTTQH